MYHRSYIHSHLASAHSLASSHDLVDQEKLLGECWGDVEPLLFGAVVVVDLLFHWGDGAHGLDIYAHCYLVFVVFVFKEDDGFLDVVSTIFC